ncbi:MAG: ABC transporter permease [Armatimonadota bacterium]|nr:ABC transporter permease [Armatimonadota bacterium]MDR7401880.1 ABC transporter permease [Armatimonadota bacterium]MDR7404935.1 ABC transporter permease [Armatimonadota bacterium]MDR7472069.1 ABC transporter permease [Armatimonadota bacterium]MDR7507164.1 ABC transporter permease [Armatimonadota bacterium]
MIRFIAHRLLALVPVLLGVPLFIMLTIDLIPGDPAALMLGEGATEEMVTALRASLDLDKPLLVRYARYVTRLLHGDLGRSIREGRRVNDEIADVWPATAQLAMAALGLAVAVGIPLGVLSARWPNSWFDNVVRVVTLFGLSMPIFWIGLIFIVVFSLWLGWLPPGGRGGLPHLVLPSVTLALPTIAMLARMTRSAMLEVLREDYIRTAHAKGVPGPRVLLRHALRNAFIPVTTVLGLQTGQLLGGAILTETVFSWPGIGRMLVRAIFARDYVLLQGGVLVLALTFVLVNLAVDLSYAYFDPRISYA